MLTADDSVPPIVAESPETSSLPARNLGGAEQEIGDPASPPKRAPMEGFQSLNEELSAVNQELKSKVAELGRSNSDLANLMAATQIATVFMDRHLAVQRYTPPAVTLFNLIPTDVGRPLADLATRLEYPGLAADAERVLDQLSILEVEVVHQDGRYFLARMLPYRTADNLVAGVVLTFVDITRCRQAEEELRASEAQLATSREWQWLIIDNAREFAIFSMDLQRRVTSWNSGAERLLGYTEAEILGRGADPIFTPEDQAADVPAKEAHEALVAGRAADERWHLRKDGSRFWASGAMMAMHADSRQAIGFVKIMRDETEARQTREALEQSREKLLLALAETERARAEAETASQTKDHFLAVLSHELRTPLMPVMMAVHMLARNRDLPESAREALEMIERNVQIEAHFIDDLLDVTRITRGKLEIVIEPLDLHQAVRHAVEVTSPDIESKQQRLTVELNATEHHLQGDATRLQQLFWNLLKNAAKFTPEGGAIRLVSRNAPGLIIVEVSDTGVGFEPGAAERIFEAFEQASLEVTRQFGGLGLGLAISKATADAHGGSLRAQSAGHLQGALFTVELPLTR